MKNIYCNRFNIFAEILLHENPWKPALAAVWWTCHCPRIPDCKSGVFYLHYWNPFRSADAQNGFNSYLALWKNHRSETTKHRLPHHSHECIMDSDRRHLDLPVTPVMRTDPLSYHHRNSFRQTTFQTRRHRPDAVWERDEMIFQEAKTN